MRGTRVEEIVSEQPCATAHQDRLLEGAGCNAADHSPGIESRTGPGKDCTEREPGPQDPGQSNSQGGT